MAKIRSKNTAPELAFRGFLRHLGIRHVYQPRLPGNPDFLVGDDLVVFIDGRFWHGEGNLPKANKEYWNTKLERNRKRDRQVTRALRARGFKVVRLDDRVVLNAFSDFRPMRRGDARKK